MGCASSGPLPFLTNRGNQAVVESTRMNGEPPYELNMVNNKLRENGVGNVKDVNVSEKANGGIGEMVEEAEGRVKGFVDEVSEKLTSAADSIEDTMGSALENLNSAVDSFEDKLHSEVTSMGESIKTVLSPAADATVAEVKAEEIDELIDSLPTEEETTEAAKTTAEETATAAEEMKNGNGE